MQPKLEKSAEETAKLVAELEIQNAEAAKKEAV